MPDYASRILFCVAGIIGYRLLKQLRRVRANTWERRTNGHGRSCPRALPDFRTRGFVPAFALFDGAYGAARGWRGSGGTAKLGAMSHASGQARTPFSADGFVIGFDLDQTLLDTRPAVAAALARAAAELDLSIDVRAAVSGLGPPLDELLAEQLPQGSARRCAQRYRLVYPVYGLPHALLLPGAREAVEAVRGRGGQAVLVTGQNEVTARAHVELEGLRVRAVVGGVWAARKAVVLRDLAADAYVGDHPADILAARAAGALGVAVATGGHFRRGEHGGADAVLDTLEEFPAWLESQNPRNGVHGQP
jgi:phosphoglycolate phosphatase